MRIKLGKIPQGPGLYFFKGSQGKILYIGKAADLRSRIRSYFSGPQTQKVNLLFRGPREIKIIPLSSEVEALVKEAAFIKKHKPKYNVLLRDDKNYFFVCLTSEDFPRIFITHQPKRFRNCSMLGPFVSGCALKTTLRLLRKIFPYCTCAKPHYRVCLTAQLGFCPGYCCQKNYLENARNAASGARRAYAKQISAIKKILGGRGSELQKQLETNLEAVAAEKRFEEAARIRDQLRGLKRVFERRGLFLEMEPNTLKIDSELSALQGLARILELAEPPRRIEFYDGSILSGTGAVGGMTAWQNGKPDKSSWRLFRMRRFASRQVNDPAQIAEMLDRRFLHHERKLPNLILVDGGMTQYSAAKAAIQRANLEIASAAIAKGKPRRDRLLWNGKIISFSKLPSDVAHLLARMRDATHRFSLDYQRKQRPKQSPTF
jgi:excinuclease ABC subunit C